MSIEARDASQSPSSPARRSASAKQFARQLAERGHDLVLVAREPRRLEALAKELEGATARSAEVLRGRPHRRRRSSRRSKRARRDASTCLVNNAGFGTFGTVPHARPRHRDARDPAQRDRARAAHPRRGARDGRAGTGGILNVSSLAGFQPGPLNATYARDEGVRHLVHRGGARRVEGHGRVGHGAVPGLHAHRVPGARRRAGERRARASCGRSARGRERRPRRRGQERGRGHSRHAEQGARQHLRRDAARRHAPPRRGGAPSLRSTDLGANSRSPSARCRCAARRRARRSGLRRTTWAGACP